MKTTCTLVVLCTGTIFGGCANRMRATLAPEYQGKTVPLERIGIGGPGATNAMQDFIAGGDKVVDLGVVESDIVEKGKANNLRYVAIVNSTDTSEAVWDGFFTFAMRASETDSGNVVWSASATYGQGGIFINQQESTKAAMRAMITDFAKTFPPADGFQAKFGSPAGK